MRPISSHPLYFPLKGVSESEHQVCQQVILKGQSSIVRNLYNEKTVMTKTQSTGRKLNEIASNG